MAKNESSVRELHSKVAVMKAEKNERYDVTTEVTERLKTAETDVALQSTLWEVVLEEMDTNKAEIVELQKQLNDKSAELPQLSVKHTQQTDKFSLAKLESAAEGTVLNDQESVAENCERHNKRAKVTHLCKSHLLRLLRSLFQPYELSGRTTTMSVARY